ncbi:hypothetical protein BH09BAC3_BH09BAC3_12460 [soil metagenome]
MENFKKFHFTAVTSSSTADLAIALKQIGHSITASGRELTAEVRSKLLSHNIIDGTYGLNESNIHAGLNAVILGQNAESDNPEILKAKALNLNIQSFADAIYDQTRDKQRIVITGSTGRTTIILMIIHVLDFHKRKFDYALSGAAGKLSSLIKLSTAPVIIIEGQDVMISSTDSVPAFLKYHHHIGLISGIEWQRSEAYPSKEDYTHQFARFAEATPKGGILIYFDLDPVVAVLSGVSKTEVLQVPYKTHLSDIEAGHEVLLSSEKKKIPLRISGKHNLQSVSAAQEVVKKIGITSEMFYEAISSFEVVAH